MTDKKISALTDLGGAPASTDVLPIVDSSANQTKKVSVESLFTNPDVTGTLTADKVGNGEIITFKQGGTATVGSIRTIAGDSIGIGTGVAGLRFINSSNRIQPVNMSTGLNSDGLTDLGDTNKRFQDLYLSGGVYLGGTGSANHLDDYEEGTFTPVITDALGGTYTGTYVGRNGRYTKIGRLVQVTFEMYVGSVDLTANGLTGSSAVVISGFPFTSNSANLTGGTISNANGINYSAEQIFCKMDRSADSVSLGTLSSSTGSNESQVTVTEFNNGNRLVYATIQYETT